MRLPCINLLLMMIIFCAVSYRQQQQLCTKLFLETMAENWDEFLQIGKVELTKDGMISKKDNRLNLLAKISLQAEAPGKKGRANCTIIH